MPNAKIGKIQQLTVDIEGKDIVLAMEQEFIQKRICPHTFDAFGLAIFDECRHHLGASVHKSMRKVACKHTLGLSAIQIAKMNFVRYLNGILVLLYTQQPKQIKITLKFVVMNTQMMTQNTLAKKYCVPENPVILE